MGKRFRGRGRGRKHGPPSKRRKSDQLHLSAKQKKHFKAYGDFHPSESSDTVKNYTRVEDNAETHNEEDSSSSDSEDETPVQQLLKAIGVGSNTAGEVSEDDDSKEDDSEEEEDKESDLDSEEEEDFEGDVHDKDGEDLDGSDHNEEGAGIITGSDMEGDTGEASHGEENDDDENELTAEASEEDCEDDDEEHILKEDDPFTVHFEQDLPETLEKKLSATTVWSKKDTKLKFVGDSTLMWKDLACVPQKKLGQKDLKTAGVKHKLVDQVAATNIKEGKVDVISHGEIMTPLQFGLFGIMNNYQDLFYPRQSHSNLEEIRLTYCLHAVNHVLKTRSRVVAHNAKIKARRGTAFDANSSQEFRDQGFTRPKVLIVVPLRNSAYRIVSVITSLLAASEQGLVSNRKRFKTEYGDEGHDEDKKGLKPEDFDALFKGNTDEHFRIGISISKKSLKLYSPFYMADIIIASPLGLRTVIGAQGDKERDYDFLSSIDLLILDQADVFLMQNWDHVLHMFDHLHLQPRESHGVDFARVRLWSLNGWSKHYRQTLIFSSVMVPELMSVYNKHCHNFAGKVQVHRKSTHGSVCRIVVQLPQMFHRIQCSSITSLADARFEFFVKEVLPQHKQKDMKQTLIYIPSYFDFVRMRNYFKKEEISFVHINEYATSKGIRRARIDFNKRKAQFMLYTERVHFYRRFKLRGPKHLIFYELPQYGHFYSELCNMLEDPRRRSLLQQIL
ncbi:hypothetical protein C0Q70_14398 [Pomacea canaliculata]|uniref:U3 small nucleolar RNA-associated protein 25 homolog n=1 Tax=Pomacea canaliculata TaxID=400727 RepID=A0A2T7NZX2_POMCA|nr:hypothetical protein C0Q70_14398 [Pomacea canaliculata]